MEITLDNAGKQYNEDWIFSGLGHTFTSGRATVILGSNGSGKSTLLQVISSAIMPTAGSISYMLEGNVVRPEHAFRLMAIAAPYIELIEEFTLTEMISFHRRLKPLIRNMTAVELVRVCELEHSANKPLKYFSSGMKQRLKLALAIMSDTPVLLLDEPVSNLDRAAIEWYKDLVDKNMRNRLVVVSSNSVSEEYGFCSDQIRLEDFKKAPQRETIGLLY
ncbi:MAG: ATP-binding cassette domain-containing protein [Bacteroidales bacterium]|nr:ATP-binding cassette domain-containing protein [Bacteroidales bacterium]MBK9356768.1 ATP-binding cassette domain-containing protein [Bacteroidales bacterium]